MLKSFIRIAWRNLLRHRFFSILHITGLSTGIAFTLLMAAYIWTEWQVNSNIKNIDDQYILQSKWKNPDMGMDITTLGMLPRAAKEAYPALIANYFRADLVSSNVSHDGKHFREGIMIGDSSFLEMYGFPLLQGNSVTALNDPYSVVITAAKAKKYFGTSNAVGQTLTIENFSGKKHDFMVSAVIDDIRKNSVMQLNAENDNQLILPASSLAFFGRDMNNWKNQYIAGYLELKKGINPKDVIPLLKKQIRQNADPLVAANLDPVLVPLKSFYFSQSQGLIKRMLMTVSFASFFILMMACVNFVNISISRSSYRLKEIGIRKVLGGLRKQLIYQFLTEAIIISFISTGFALVIYQWAKPVMENILAQTLPAIQDMPVIFFFIPVTLAMVIGLLAGIYPAFVLSSVNAIHSIKREVNSIKENLWLRKALVGFQFFVAMLVFSGALIIGRQVTFFFSRSLGYDKDFILTAQVPRNWSPEGVRKMEMVRNEFAALPQVAEASLSYQRPDGGGLANLQLYKSSDDSSHAISGQLVSSDTHFASTYGILLKAGIFLSEQDSLKIVVNETAVKSLGWKNVSDALGQKVKLSGGPQVFTIAGVINDYHNGSMQAKIQPEAFLSVRNTTVFRYLNFRLKKGNVKDGLNALQKKWNTLLPGAPFEYSFMDDTLSRIYQKEIQLKRAAITATIMAFIIVLLGVTGLVAAGIQKRIKEIGIRKVLGAGIKDLILLFLREYVYLIFGAFVLSVPFAWYLMNKWLENYAYRISLSSLPFLISLSGLCIITSILVTIQIVNAALNKPMKNLRTE